MTWISCQLDCWEFARLPSGGDGHRENQLDGFEPRPDGQEPGPLVELATKVLDFGPQALQPGASRPGIFDGVTDFGVVAIDEASISVRKGEDEPIDRLQAAAVFFLGS
jgi:hypothetical protein